MPQLHRYLKGQAQLFYTAYGFKVKRILFELLLGQAYFALYNSRDFR